MEPSSVNSTFVPDTHTLFWYLVASDRLSPTARRVFDDARRGRATLIISPIVLLELYGVVRKLQSAVDFESELANFEQPPYRVESIAIDDLRLLDRLTEIPELHDRLISATALRPGATVVTRDPKIRACAAVQSVW